MDVIIIASLTILLYMSASIVQALTMQGLFSRARSPMMLLAFIAVVAHGLLLHEWIDIPSGQNLSVLNMLSLCAWLVATLTWVVMLIRQVEMLGLFIFPFCAVSIILVLAFPGVFVINTALHPGMLFHIIVSVFAFCLLCVAGLLAVLLAFQERKLRLAQGSGLLSKLPPLETMETLLFQVIGLGFILLSVVLITSFYSYHAVLMQHFVLLQKALLVVAAWIIFAVLLAGRYRYGWRGRKAIYGTLIGVLLLVLAYFGSKLVLEALQ